MPLNEKLRQKNIENLQYATLILINTIDKSIEQNASEGIFRISAGKPLIDSKMAEIKKGTMDFAALTQLEHAALLKAVIRELQTLREPLFSYRIFDNLKKAQEQIDEAQGQAAVDKARRQYEEMRRHLFDEGSDVNKKIAFRLFALLNKISMKSGTKMPAANLAIVMTPNLFEMPSNMPLVEQGLATLSMNKICADLIEKVREIIKPDLHLLSTHYEAKVKDPKENRFHIFNANGNPLGGEYKGLKGDYLKTRILLNFQKQLEEATSENINTIVDKLEKSPEYDVLATSQGFVTWFFELDTSSVKAFREMVAERRSDLEFERTLAMK